MRKHLVWRNWRRNRGPTVPLPRKTRSYAQTAARSRLKPVREGIADIDQTTPVTAGEFLPVAGAGSSDAFGLPGFLDHRGPEGVL